MDKAALRTAVWDDLEAIDLVVAGSVAVTPAGVRVGKGKRFSEDRTDEAGVRWEQRPIGFGIDPVNPCAIRDNFISIQYIN